DLSPLRESRSFRLLWAGQLVSLTGTQLRLVAVPYQIFLLTGSSLDVGLIGLFQAVPLIALALFGGVVADRVDRRRLLIATQIGLASCSLALAVGTQLGFASVPSLSAFTVLGSAFAALVAPPRELRAHPAVGRALAEGLAHFRANRILFGTMLLDFFATFFGSPRALFPYYAARVFAVGPGGLGLLFAAPGIGSLIAALASGWTKGVRHQGVAVLVAVAAWGLAIVGFGLMNDGLFIPAPIFVALAEVADTISAIFRSTILLTVVPDHLRGRLVAISSMFFLGGPYLGQVESGVVAGLVSPEFSVVSGGVAPLASGVGIALWAPEVTRYVSPAPEAKVASSGA